MTHRVRTTILPHIVLDVDDAEYTDLSRAGLLIADTPPIEPAPPAPEPQPEPPKPSRGRGAARKKGD